MCSVDSVIVTCQVHIERRLQAGHSLDEPMSDDVLTAAFERYLRLEVLLNDTVRPATCNTRGSVTDRKCHFCFLQGM